MASLTIRKLDDAIRDELRLRAARNGRSVEDEVRVILREASQKPCLVRHGGLPGGCSAGRPGDAPSWHRSVGPCARHADHRRRHRRLQGAGPDPAAQGAPHSCSLRAD